MQAELLSKKPGIDISGKSSQSIEIYFIRLAGQLYNIVMPAGKDLSSGARPIKVELVLPEAIELDIRVVDAIKQKNDEVRKL